MRTAARERQELTRRNRDFSYNHMTKTSTKVELYVRSTGGSAFDIPNSAASSAHP